MELTQFLTRIKDLNVSRSGGAPKPYKPAMLLAGVLWTRLARPADNLLTLSELGPVFHQVLGVVAPTSRRPDSDTLPFGHLAGDGVWTIVDHPDAYLVTGSSMRLRDRAARAAGVALPEAVFRALRDDHAYATDCIQSILSSSREIFAPWGADPARVAAALSGWLAAVAPEAGLSITESPRRTLGDRRLEQRVAERLPLLGGPGSALRARQLLTPVGIIDLVAGLPAGALRPDPSWAVLHVRRPGGDDLAIAQVSRARSWLAAEHAGGDLSRCSGLIVSAHVSEGLRMAVRSLSRTALWQAGPGDLLAPAA